jgi:hypothetical protein
MAARKEFNEVLGRIITDRPFGDKFLRDPEEAAKSMVARLNAQEMAQLSKLTSADVSHLRTVLGV